MTDNRMNILYHADGEATSSAFSIKIPSNDIVYDLKAHIKAEKTAEFDDIAHSLACLNPSPK